jgi:hypothetical protein
MVQRYEPDLITDEGLPEILQTLRDPGDEIIVADLSVISRNPDNLDATVQQILDREYVILVAKTGHRITDYESFVEGLRATKGGMTSKQARANRAKSRGNRVADEKIARAKHLWERWNKAGRRAEGSMEDIARRAGISLSTLYRYEKQWLKDGK